MTKTIDIREPRRAARKPTRFEEDVQAIAKTALEDAKLALDKARDGINLALRELNYLRGRGAAGIN
ncbi:MAG TPA: hypothetical protein VNS52_18625 [Gemmatimonadaceae bacterium]|nr:hypothetical protein [Gemmatimonadaceae bacterium]